MGKIKNLLLFPFFKNKNRKRKERFLKAKDKNLRYSKFLSCATKVAVNCLPMQISVEIYYTWVNS